MLAQITAALVKGVIALGQLLPLTWLARIGRVLGGLAWHLDRRHRRVALENLTAALGAELGPEGVPAVARENFRRLGENYLCALKTAGMSSEALAAHVEWPELTGLTLDNAGSVVVAVGHFGNFELYAHATKLLPGWSVATTYRGLRQAALNGVLLALRQKTGALYFERTREAGALRLAMARGRTMLGLLSDQHAGDKGLWLPFLGRPCSTSAAPAVLAQRFGVRLHTGICYRTGLARWRIEFGPEIPTRTAAGDWRSAEEIMTDVNRTLEQAVRRDPANWFWVHRRWKPASRQQRARLAGGDRPAAGE